VNKEAFINPKLHKYYLENPGKAKPREECRRNERPVKARLEMNHPDEGWGSRGK
jgi:hypothetical protein